MGLLTARATGWPSDGLADDVPPGQVISALTAVSGALLDAVAPGDAGLDLLQGLGRVAAGGTCRRGGAL